MAAYRRVVSCGDAIFATRENCEVGSHVYMCLYDLQKGFDSVEHAVLLEK